MIGERFTNLSHSYKDPYISGNKYIGLNKRGELSAGFWFIYNTKDLL